MIKKYILSSVRNKLLFIAGIGTTLVVSASLYGISNGWSVAQEMTQIIGHGQGGYIELSTDFKTQVQEWKNVLIRGHDDKQREKYWGKFNKNHESVQSEVSRLVKQSETAELRQKLVEFKNVHSQLLPLYKKGLDAFVSSGYDHIAGDKAVKGIDREPAKLLGEIGRIIEKQLEEKMQTIENHAENGVKMTATLLIIAVLISFIIFLVMVKKIIVRPVQNVARDLANMADGDFSKEIIPLCQDEIGDLALSAAKLRDDMGSVVE